MIKNQLIHLLVYNYHQEITGTNKRQICEKKDYLNFEH